MSRRVEIIAYHGWGMNAKFWSKWDEYLPEYVTLKKNDRGYFNEPIKHHFEDKEAIRILFVQGFGIHWVPQSEWANAHLIVLFSAFNNLKEIMKKSRTVDHVVKQLQQEIEHQPYKTMQLFWDEMFTNSEKVVDIDNFEIHNKSLLINDLNAYYNDLVKSIKINHKAKVLLYESELDELSVFTQAKTMKDLFGRLDYFKKFDYVGHAYPFSHAKECYEDLKSHLKILREG